MLVIISRKGFDSSSGGVPSPIFPDGKMLSLPTPDKDPFTWCHKILVSLTESMFMGGVRDRVWHGNGSI